MTISQIFLHLYATYGTRNREHMSDLLHRVGFLIIGIADLQSAIRKDFSIEIIDLALARVFARIVCVADYLGQPDVASAMSSKYPPKGCSYCQNFPCICTDRRKEAKLTDPSCMQRDWYVRDWQSFLGDLYGEKNFRRGIDNIMSRLFAESAEVISEVMRAETGRYTNEETMTRYALEIADLIAWSMAVANFYSIDLEVGVIERYGHGCWKCKKIPCECGPFNIEMIDWTEVGSSISGE